MQPMLVLQITEAAYWACQVEPEHSGQPTRLLTMKIKFLSLVVAICALLGTTAAAQTTRELRSAAHPQAQLPTPAIAPSSAIIQPTSAAVPTGEIVPSRDPLGESARTRALPISSVPRPTPEILQKFGRFVDRTIDPEEVLELLKGRARTIVLKQFPVRYQIGDDKIAAASFVQPNQLTVLGKEVGATVLNLWFENKEQPGDEILLSYLVRVLPDPEAGLRLEQIYRALEEEINRNFPDSVVHLSIVGDRVVVQGQAHDVEQATQILRLVSQCMPDSDQNCQQNGANTACGGYGPAGGDAMFGGNGLGGFGGYGSGFLDGFRSQVGVDALQINSRIVNLLRVPGEQQVMLKVTVADVSRKALRSIGANLEIGDMVDSSVNFFTMLPTNVTGGNLLVNRGDFRLALNALRTLGLARTLAEPNLVTMNGQPATFHAGNMFPTQVLSGYTASGLQGTIFNPIGVQLMFLPVITDKDRIRLTINSSVSKIDQENFNDTGNPTLEQRGFSTIVELRDGETLAVAGLIHNTFTSDSDRVPWLGDVPVIGRAFASDVTELQERELIILVTPQLVAPWPAGSQTPPVAGFDMVEPSDVEFYLLGRIESHCAQDYRSTVPMDIKRMQSFRNVQQQVIIGPSGYSDGQ